MKKFLFSLALILFAALASQAQTLSISGVVRDNQDNSLLVSANVWASSLPDSSIVKGGTTDLDGKFLLTGLPAGTYKLHFSYIGYAGMVKVVKLIDKPVDLGEIKLYASSVSLKDVKVEEKAIRTEQKGDTTQYNANAFKTNPDATMGDLVQKMPGITLENGTLKAHGEDVKKVMIDGKEFFGDDVNTALKNLPAEVIDKIQVFDKLSDQSQLTGFNDGNTTKTINIVTKPGKANGQFGKIFGGAGVNDNLKDGRYQSGLNLNLFSKKRKISIIAQSNNINQQNFSAQDLAGIFPPQNNGPGGGMGGGGRGSGGGGMGGPPGMQNPADNFTVNSLGGITTTHAAGINYSESWGKKLTISAYYFFNNSKNKNQSSLERNYFNKELKGQQYTEDNSSNKDNLNHRANMRLEFNPDTNNSIIFTPKLTFQNAKTNSTNSGLNTVNSVSLNNAQTDNKTESLNYNYSADLMYQHKFMKRGRTFSINGNMQGSDKNGTSGLGSQNNYFQTIDTLELSLNQTGKTLGNSRTFGGNISYTEPLGKKSILEFGYNPSFLKNTSDKQIYSTDTTQNTFLDSTLSSKYNNTYDTHKARLSYRFRTPKLNFMLSAAYQYAELKGEQAFPRQTQIYKSFNNILPMAMTMIQFNKNTSLRLFYRTNTNAPSVSQLQNVVDNSNPLVLSTGNPALQQDFSQNVGGRFSLAKPDKAQSLFAFANLSITSNYIGNSTFISTIDSVLPQGIKLYKGSRITSPVNLSGYANIRSFLTYGLPVSFLKSNLNINAGFIYGRTPSLINGVKNLANTYSPTAGLVLSSNINEKIDFTLSFTANYYVVQNTILPQSNSNYYNQVSNARLNWQFWKGFVISSELTHIQYSGLGQAYNTSYFLWNGGLAYKFLKNQAAELRFSVFDLLNQNQSVSRTVTDTYTENNRSLVLNRYYMMTFTYTLRKFKKAE